jgi:hypothetical protein
MFDKTKVQAIAGDLRTAVEDLARKHGVGVAVGVAHFNTETIRVKLEFSTTADGAAISPSGRQFKRYARMYGLEPDDLGAPFTWKGRQYTIVGLNPRKMRMPIEARRDDGAMFGIASEAVCRALGRKPVVPALQETDGLLGEADEA